MEKKKGIFVSEHPVSNPKLLFPNIVITPLHYKVDPPKVRKNRDYSMKSAHEWVLNASQRVNNNRLKTN